MRCTKKPRKGMTADINMQNGCGSSALHVASNQGMRGTLECLVQSCDKSMISARDQKGKTPLDYAKRDSVQSILQAKGAELSTKKSSKASWWQNCFGLCDTGALVCCALPLCPCAHIAAMSDFLM